MKFSHLVISSLCGIAALSVSPAFAQAQNGKPAGNQRLMPPPPALDPDKMFDNMDTNKDGSISRAEFKAAHQKMQAKRDEFFKRRMEQMKQQ